MDSLKKITTSDEVNQFLSTITPGSKVSLYEALKNQFSSPTSQKEIKESKESKEVKKIEKEPFVIDKGLSLDEKIAKGWKLLVDQPAFIMIEGERKRTTITVLQHPAGDVWEYIDGVPQEFIGKQLFTSVAAARETLVADKDVAQSRGEFKSVVDNWDESHQDLIEKAQQKEGFNRVKSFAENNLLLLGYRNPKDGIFYGIGRYTNIWVGSECLKYFPKRDLRTDMDKKTFPDCGFPVYCYAK